MARKLIPWDMILRHLKGIDDEQEKKAFQQWIADKENADLFVEIEDLWKEIQRKVSPYTPDIEYYWAKMEAEINKRQQRRFILKYMRPIVAAASVALLIVATAVLGYWAGRSSQPMAYATQQFSTTTAKSKVMLPDGSTVLLNRESMLSFDMEDGNRNVQLVGEGFFEVAKDAKHPFYVNTKEVSVKVYGTKFNVRSYAHNKNTKVSLIEGHISLLKDGDEFHMQTGQLAVLDKQTKKLTIGKSDIEMDTLWKRNSISFNNKSLWEICTYLEKWYDVSIDLDPSVEKQSYTFTITSEPIEVILQNMILINPIQYEIDDREVKIYKSKN